MKCKKTITVDELKDLLLDELKFGDIYYSRLKQKNVYEVLLLLGNRRKKIC